MKHYTTNKRYCPHEIATKIHSVQIYRQTKDISYVCRKYKISKASLMRWNKQYDGTKESLMPKSHRPHSPHPNAHTEQELNGAEFTHFTKTKRTHPFDVFCNHYKIEHKLIRPRTPWHNGKVERSHRNDQERFYNYLSFYSFADLQEQMKRYLRRSNAIPMAVLGWKSPNQKQVELENTCV